MNNDNFVQNNLLSSLNQNLSLLRPQTEENRIKDILYSNQDKNFIQRILKPEEHPILNLPNDQFATHKMAWTNIDGKPIVYPNVIQDSQTGKLIELSPQNALKHALQTNEFIPMKNNHDAEWFSSNYKKVWNIDGKNITFKKSMRNY